MATIESARPRAAVRVADRPQSIPTWLIAVLVGGLAILPRVLGLADFYTVDEAYHWAARTRAFAQAVQAHDWAHTNQTGHPGVTTMWLGALGYWMHDWAGIYLPGRTGDGASYLALLRLPLALANSLAVAGGYLIVRRLLRPPAALLAGLLWATTPFLVAHSRVLHLDAILTSCTSLSLLLLLLATQPRDRSGRPAAIGPLIGSGIFTGLALLTKAPALLILPFAGIWLLLVSPQRGPAARLGWAGTRYLIWLGCALAVAYAGWPALWVAPREAIMAVVGEIVANGGKPHSWGSFFLGRPVGDPGWAFYPAVIAWRMTPLALIGLALAPLALWWQPRERRTLLALIGFALYFMLVMGAEPKKFDRYLLPIWPALLIVAAAGLSALVDRGARWWRRARPHRRAPRATALGLTALSAALLAEVLAYHPYTLAYFNPLLGGGPAAARVLLVGWGEGMEQAGAWLRARPDLAEGTVMARNPPTLEPFLPLRVSDLTANNLLGKANYAVLYISYLQRQSDTDLAGLIERTPPLHTVMINGMPYAMIYQLPRPFQTPIEAVFGDSLHLRGITLEQGEQTLTITPSWDIQRDQPSELFVFVHVLGPDGKHLAQADQPLDLRFRQLQAGQQLSSPIRLALPAHSAGAGRIVLGVYDPASGARLGVTQGPALPGSIDGPGVVELARLDRP
ncbi:MAG: glycosyltransferase family 39 protein [Kouleothrix sp.]|jgi:4-amino-4-deoxy-L-arabinose transferase-like glycosyltransferase|nr:glycosyltransferase family 39 protein [Kouleothrix sp.]